MPPHIDHLDKKIAHHGSTIGSADTLSYLSSHKMEKMAGEDRPQEQKLAIAYSYARKLLGKVSKLKRK